VGYQNELLEIWIEPALTWLHGVTERIDLDKGDFVSFLTEEDHGKRRHRDLKTYTTDRRYTKTPLHYERTFRFLDSIKGSLTAPWKRHLGALIIASDVFLHDVQLNGLGQHFEAIKGFDQQKLLDELACVLARERIKELSENRKFYLKNFGVLDLPALSFEGDFAKYRQMAINSYGHVLQILPKVLAYLAKTASQPDLQKNFAGWFGPHDNALLETLAADDVRGETALARVTRKYEQINEVMTTKLPTISFHGSACKDGADGYVNAERDENHAIVHLCLKVFIDPKADRAGTVLHEFSHAAAKTKDHRTGDYGCLDLVATKEYVKAADNADTYRCYAENWKGEVADWS
jgi:lysine-specific metallo-endopeptidase family protein